jgi:hypothetical protein
MATVGHEIVGWRLSDLSRRRSRPVEICRLLRKGNGLELRLRQLIKAKMLAPTLSNIMPAAIIE